ncbi:unnamed protein product [Triticum turgidum subsp. durum]|uniref:Uncharacterized protein n=1 Tax=Triticum turgidum subsp. durum TaxID=4567 RepID=A0A9R0XDT9_TRITD|nr:unnamed protein product [Triticum turgidum subsp. durum]
MEVKVLSSRLVKPAYKAGAPATEHIPLSVFDTKEGLAPSAVLKDVVCPDVEVDSWLTFPFYELDFGTGSPSYFMPSYFPTEGMLFLAPSYLGDGSVDAFVPVFRHNLQAFKECCYSME